MLQEGKDYEGVTAGRGEAPLAQMMSSSARGFLRTQGKKKTEKEQHGLPRARWPLDKPSTLLPEYLKDDTQCPQEPPRPRLPSPTQRLPRAALPPEPHAELPAAAPLPSAWEVASGPFLGLKGCCAQPATSTHTPWPTQGWWVGLQGLGAHTVPWAGGLAHPLSTWPANASPGALSLLSDVTLEKEYHPTNLAISLP